MNWPALSLLEAQGRYLRNERSEDARPGQRLFRAFQPRYCYRHKFRARATQACQLSAQPIAIQLIPALNAMFDLATTRTAAIQIHQPLIIFIMLGVLALVCALLAGYAMAGGKSRSWIHVIGFALVLALTVYVILDLEFPRVGMIRIDSLDQILVDLWQSMN